MRPHFVIYLAAGLTLFFAVILIFTHIGDAYNPRRAANKVQLTGDDLARYEAARKNDFDSTAETLTLTGIQPNRGLAQVGKQSGCFPCHGVKISRVTKKKARNRLGLIGQGGKFDITTLSKYTQATE
jgi:hypothetical protein